MFHAIPGLTLGHDLSLRIGDSPELRLTPRAGFELAEALLRRSTEAAVKEAAQATRAKGNYRPATRKRAAA